MSDLDDEFQTHLATIEEGKANFGDDEQNIIGAWTTKLSDPNYTDEEKTVRNEYARTLAKLTTEEKQLLPPFSEMPLEGSLMPLADVSGPPQSQATKPTFQIRKMPCSRVKAPPPKTGVIPKTKKRDVSPQEVEDMVNEFADPEEMAKVIARSKGQSFADFVASISRHTEDFGQALRSAMKAETSSFREYVENVLSQRIKDLTEVMDEEQNLDLRKIKKDMDKWQLELSYCKKRIKEIIPDFDLEDYRKDKNYLKKIFTIESAGVPQDDSFKTWKEEACHRLKWYSDMIFKLTRCNDTLTQELTEIKSKTLDLEAREALKQQNHMQFINCELTEYQKLKCERDRVHEETAHLLSQLEDN